MDRNNMTDKEAAWLIFHEPGTVVTKPGRDFYRVRGGRIETAFRANFKGAEFHDHPQISGLMNGAHPCGWYVVEQEAEQRRILERTNKAIAREGAFNTATAEALSSVLGALLMDLDARYQRKE